MHHWTGDKERHPQRADIQWEHECGAGRRLRNWLSPWGKGLTLAPWSLCFDSCGGCWDRETKTRAPARWTSTKKPCRKPGPQRMRLTVKVYQKYTRLTDGDSKGKGSFQPDSRWRGEQFNSKHSQPTAVSSEDLPSKFTLLMLSCGLPR